MGRLVQVGLSLPPPDSTSGDDFFIWEYSGGTVAYSGGTVGVPVGYTSGNSITSEMVFNGETIASLNMISGTYNYAIPNDTITLNIEAVPIPAAVWLFGSGLLGLVGMARRKKAA